MTHSFRLLIALLAIVNAQETSAVTPRQNKPAVVSVAVSEPVTITPGDTTEMQIPITILEDYHVQANPASTEFLIPLQLKIENGDGVKTGKPIYPPGNPYLLQGTTEPLTTYSGTIAVIIPLLADSLAKPGIRLLSSTVYYQACDARRCMFPASVSFIVPVEVNVSDEKSQMNGQARYE